MDGDWLTYRQAAEKLGTTAEGARRRARWPRQRGNDGQALVKIPEGALDGPRPVRAPSARPDSAGADPAIAHALEGHVATLKAELAHRDSEIDTLKAELGTRNSDLAAERERADKVINGFEALLRTESERADRAIAAFESLAQRLEEMAAAKRPAWRRWLGLAG
jgi:hypothetical protein